MLKQAKAGKSINDEDIPPPVSVGKKSDMTQPLMPQNVPNTPEQPSTLSEPPVPPRRAPAPPPRSESLGQQPLISPEPKEPPPQLPVEPSIHAAKEEGLKLIMSKNFF